MMPSSFLSKSTVLAQLSSNVTSRLLSSSTGDQALQNSSYIGHELGAGNKLKAYLDEDDCSGEQLSGGADHDQQNSTKMEEGAAAAISGGGAAAGSGEEQDPDNLLQPPSKKSKRYHRHTAFQIQQLESFFKECAHPDEKQRQELSEALGLSVRQVKFWFQNRRTQMKAQQERSDNAHLRAENERLRTENITIREAIKHASCPSCGTGPSSAADVAFDEQQLRMENLRLREELEHITMVATRYFGRPIPQLGGRSISNVLPSSSLELGAEPNNVATSSDPTILAADHHHHHHHQYQQPIGLVEQAAAAAATVHESRQMQQQHSPTLLEIALRPGGISEMEKAAVAELAMGAVQEVLQVVHAQDPLWIQDNDSNVSRLDTEMYFKQFPGGIGPRPPGLSTEATRDTGLVIMNSLTLLDALMDVNKWTEMFPSIISKALTVEVLSPGIPPTLDGALQLMYAELQVLSPLVRTREIYFLRYCKQAADKLWVVVDVSIDCLRDNPPPCLLQCRRRPSGCIIQDMPNGYSQVTWLEHLETDQHDVNPLYSSLVSSGTAFGAKRWLCTLQRYCENLASLLATNIPARDLGVVNSLEGRRCMLRLAQRMANRYVGNVSASSTSNWVSANGAGPNSATTTGVPNKGSSTISNNNIAAPAADHEDVRVMTRDNPGDGVLLCAATSTWLPFSRQRVFDFLRNERFRAQWDVLANGPTQEMIHIAKGQHPGNSVSLLRVNGSSPSQSNVLILQESSTDDSGSLVVYMPVDFSTVTRVLQGEDPSDVLMLLPSGFAILPDGPTESTIDAGNAATTDGIHNKNNDITDAAPPPLDEPSSSSSSTALMTGAPHLVNKPTALAGGGCLLTVSFQIAVSHVPSSGKLNMDSVNTVSKIILSTLQHIKAALQHWDH